MPRRADRAGADGEAGAGRLFAYIVNPGDPLERRTIAVAAIQDGDGLVIVTKGLKPGEQVGSGGQHRLAKGAPHRPESTT